MPFLSLSDNLQPKFSRFASRFGESHATVFFSGPLFGFPFRPRPRLLRSRPALLRQASPDGSSSLSARDRCVPRGMLTP